MSQRLEFMWWIYSKEDYGDICRLKWMPTEIILRKKLF